MWTITTGHTLLKSGTDKCLENTLRSISEGLKTPHLPCPPAWGIQWPKVTQVQELGGRGSEQQHGGFLEVETANDWLNDYNHHRPGSHHEADFAPLHTPDRFSSLNDYLKCD